MIGGKTRSRTSSGASSTAGSPGMSASATPVSTRRMAGGNLEASCDKRSRRNHDQQYDQDLDRRDQARTG